MTTFSLNAALVPEFGNFGIFLCRIDMPPVIWDDLVQLGYNSWGKKTLKCLICRLILGSMVYNLWRTKNKLRMMVFQVLKSSC